MTYTMEQYEESAQAIRARLKGFVPKVAMVLGSGLGFLGDQVEDPIAIDYHDIPHFKTSTAPGHKGRLVCGMLDGQRVAVMQGRMHHYEGYSYEEVSYAVRVLRLLGCDTLVVTNAAGCVRQDWHAGELMLITDQIKMFSPSPLRGENLPQFGPRFPDASHLYSPRLQQLARDAARELGLTDQFVIGNIGRLCQQKNQSFLLDVLAQGAKLRPDLRLLLIGEGGDLAALKEKAERLGVADRVLFYGTTQHPERLLWAMDVFAFPSLFEGLGIVAIEAQAAGLPVVCSEHVPPEAAVTPLVTRLPLDEGAAAWANALLKLPEAEQTSGAEQVRQGGFDVADVARRIERTYMGSEHGETNDFRRHSGV